MDKLKELILNEARNTPNHIIRGVTFDGYTVEQTDQCILELQEQRLLEVTKQSDGNHMFRGQKVE